MVVLLSQIVNGNIDRSDYGKVKQCVTLLLSVCVEWHDKKCRRSIETASSRLDGWLCLVPDYGAVVEG